MTLYKRRGDEWAGGVATLPGGLRSGRLRESTENPYSTFAMSRAQIPCHCYPRCPAPAWKQTFGFRRWVLCLDPRRVEHVLVLHYQCATCQALGQSQIVLGGWHVGTDCVSNTAGAGKPPVGTASETGTTAGPALSSGPDPPYQTVS